MRGREGRQRENKPLRTACASTRGRRVLEDGARAQGAPSEQFTHALARAPAAVKRGWPARGSRRWLWPGYPGTSAGSRSPCFRQPMVSSQVLAWATAGGSCEAADAAPADMVAFRFQPSNHRADEAGSRPTAFSMLFFTPGAALDGDAEDQGAVRGCVSQQPLRTCGSASPSATADQMGRPRVGAALTGAIRARCGRAPAVSARPTGGGAGFCAARRHSFPRVSAPRHASPHGAGILLLSPPCRRT
jgi:hypothetical protein